MTPLEAAKAIYEQNGVGCCLHIVLDDYNVGDSSVAWALDHARANTPCECGSLCVEVGEAMLPMSEDDRLRFVEQVHGYEPGSLDDVISDADNG